VIIIDEIGRELEALAARTIAERGVQLIATAHGNTLENLILNPTLCDLIGGIESVTLSDEEARRRRTQKTVLERRAPPTFDVVIEIKDWNHVAVHPDVATAVDGLLRNRPVPAQIRYRDEHGEIQLEEEAVSIGQKLPSVANRRVRPLKPLKVYPYGLTRNRLHEAAQRLDVPIQVLDDLEGAEAVITLKNYYRNRPRLLVEAEDEGIPIYVLRSNTVTQMESCLVGMHDLHEEDNTMAQAMRETQEAIRKVISGARMIELSPQNAYVRRKQHQLAQSHDLVSHSRGKEPHRRVRIYRE
jgi:hypothetical protein